MPVALLEQARALRTQADRARRLVRDNPFPTDILEKLTEYAAELDQRALESEASAVSLAETLAKTRRLSAEITGLVNEVKARLQRIKGRPDHTD